MSQTTQHDEKVLQLMAIVAAKRAAIENATNGSYKTGTNFNYTPASAHTGTDVAVITDVRKIVEMFAFLKERSKNYVESANELGVKTEFKWQGYTVDEWKAVFQIRVDQLDIQAKRKELAKIEESLNAITSPELRTKLELDRLSKELLG